MCHRTLSLTNTRIMVVFHESLRQLNILMGKQHANEPHAAAYGQLRSQLPCGVDLNPLDVN